MGNPAVFLDLNGTLVLPVQVQCLSEYRLLPGIAAAIRDLNEQGFLCPVVTVQSRIAKGLYSEDDFRRWFADFQNTLTAQGAVSHGLYLCPHSGSDNCRCRKPQPFLYQQAAAEWEVDITRSFVVGDTREDMLAANKLGCPGCLVRTGWGESSITQYQADAVANYIATDLIDAARWIVSSRNG